MPRDASLSDIQYEVFKPDCIIFFWIVRKKELKKKENWRSGADDLHVGLPDVGKLRCPAVAAKVNKSSKVNTRIISNKNYENLLNS